MDKQTKTTNALEFLAQELDMPPDHIREAAKAIKYNKAKDKWNGEADEFNQWDSLSEDEKQELICEYKKHKLEMK
jgi:hypothetical protein